MNDVYVGALIRMLSTVPEASLDMGCACTVLSVGMEFAWRPSQDVVYRGKNYETFRELKPILWAYFADCHKHVALAPMLMTRLRW